MRLLMVAPACVLLAVASAAAAPARVSLAVVPSAVPAGAAVRVVGNAGSCPAGNAVTAISRAFPGRQFGGEGAFMGRVRRGGSFAIRGRVRSTLHAGRYAVTARCGGGNLGVTAFVRVRRGS